MTVGSLGVAGRSISIIPAYLTTMFPFISVSGTTGNPRVGGGSKGLKISDPSDFKYGQVNGHSRPKTTQPRRHTVQGVQAIPNMDKNKANTLPVNNKELDVSIFIFYF